MRRAFLLAVFFSLPAAATPHALGAMAGAVVEGDGWSAAPAVELSGRASLGSRFFVGGGVQGWTFAQSIGRAAGTEVVLAVGPGVRAPLSSSWAFVVSAAPALALTDEVGAPLGLAVGAAVAPSFELSTRRRTLAVQVGARGTWLTTGPRVSAGAGVVYSFH